MLKHVKFDGFAKGRSDDGFSIKNNPFSYEISNLIESKKEKYEDFVEIVTQGKNFLILINYYFINLSIFQIYKTNQIQMMNYFFIRHGKSFFYEN